jgi:cation diffusion facilitator CzcD-associated flavoprotein CzcO
MVRSVRSVAIVGLGPAGAISIDALAAEGFERIRVFERREAPGGCWLQDPPEWTQQLPDLEAIAARTADRPLPLPGSVPACTPRSTQYRFAETSIYPELETNVCASAMQFSKEPIPRVVSAAGAQRHGHDSPFRPHRVVRQWLEGLVQRHDCEHDVVYNVWVERISKSAQGKWTLTLRQTAPDAPQHDYWWSEEFDAVVVASGHYIVPFVPSYPGLQAFADAHSGSVEHSKAFRGASKYVGKVGSLRCRTVSCSLRFL